MATRRQAREWALQLLVQLDLNPDTNLAGVLDAFWGQLADLERERLADDPRATPVLTGDPADASATAALAEARAFAETRVRGVLGARAAIDALLETRLRNWALYRLGTVERNVLRLGIWELQNCPDIPPPIVINESVDLAKFFSETKSGRFVNAILDTYAKECRRAQQEGVFTP